MTYTAQNLFSEYRLEAEQFLSGLVFADKIPEESVNPAENPRNKSWVDALRM